MTGTETKTTDATAVHWLTLTQAGEAIRKGSATPVALTEALLARIEEAQPRLHAFITVLGERALARAKEAEAEIAGGRYRGPLHGIPIAVKDLCWTKGIRTTAGTAVLRDHVPDEDATVVERLEAAGAVILGKLSMTEGAYATHHPSVPPPVNPWGADRWTGVSSSGSGVATAAGLCYGSLGSDTAGSIRFPSAACGVVGIKPTWGRVSRYGVFALGASLDHIGPMTRSVADAAAMLAVLAGHDPKDPTSLRAAVPDYAAAVGRGVRGLRIGVDERYATEDLDDEVTGLVMATVDVLRRLGAEIVAVKVPPIDDVLRTWALVCAAEAAAAHVGLYPEREAEYGPVFGPFLAMGRAATAVDYAQAHEERLKFNGGLAGVFEEVDLLLCPSLGVATPGKEGSRLPEEIGRVMRFTAPFDFSGSPTISVPCGFTADGMPASLQLVGRHLGEESLIAAGAAYEQATEWHTRHPG
ncbi:MAG: amidase [Tepidiformaceae bacterium]